MRFEGHHEDHQLPFKRGQKVLIPAGTEVHTTASRRVYTTKRNQYITISRFLPGQSVSAHTALNDKDYYYPLLKKGYDFAPLQKMRDEDYDAYYEHRVAIMDPQVIWVGSGGYWCQANINDILAANGVIEQPKAA